MQKIFDAGFAAGQEAAEDQRHAADGFRDLDKLPSWHEVAMRVRQRRERLSAREQEFIDSVAARTK
jgi:hypothetical protein